MKNPSFPLSDNSDIIEPLCVEAVSSFLLKNANSTRVDVEGLAEKIVAADLAVDCEWEEICDETRASFINVLKIRLAKLFNNSMLLLDSGLSEALMNAFYSRGIIVSPVSGDSLDIECKTEEAFDLLTDPRISGFSKIACLKVAIPCLGDEQIMRIAHCPCTSFVSSFDVFAQRMSDQGFFSILESEFLENLKELFIRYSRVGDEGAFAIAGSPKLSKIRTLNLGRSDITDRGVFAIAHSPFLKPTTEVVALCDNLSRERKQRIEKLFAKRDCYIHI